MGCWSESCALSGMEISDGDTVYVALVIPSRSYGHSYNWILKTPPVKGTYDDYGGVNLTEDTPNGPKSGENWRPDNEIQGATAQQGLPVYFDAELFEYLENLENEFPYHWTRKGNVMVSNVNTIGMRRDLHVQDIRDAINETLENKKKYEELSNGPAKGFSIVYERPLHEVFVSSEDRGVLDGAENFILDRIESGQTDFEEFLKFYGRAYVLTCAQHELRKQIVPGTYGPQHGGADALLQFSKEVSRLTEIHKYRWDEDEIEDEE